VAAVAEFIMGFLNENNAPSEVMQEVQQGLAQAESAEQIQE
jgi:hypothetical protein